MQRAAGQARLTQLGSASLLHPAEQGWDPVQAAPLHLGSSIQPPQPGNSQSQLLRELNKHLGWYIPDKALFYSAKQCHTSYLTQIRSVAPVALQSSNLTPDTLVWARVITAGAASSSARAMGVTGALSQQSEQD